MPLSHQRKKIALEESNRGLNQPCLGVISSSDFAHFLFAFRAMFSWPIFGLCLMLLCSVVGEGNSVGASTDSDARHNFSSVPSRQTLASLLAVKSGTERTDGDRGEEDNGVIAVQTAPDLKTKKTRTKKTRPSYLNSTCTVRASEGSRIPEKIRHLIDVEEVKLIEYNLDFPRYNASPLASNSTVYKAESWSRVSSRHGQTLLSLSFNYGILSMMTLAVGTASIVVPLEDVPYGCLEGLSDGDQLDLLLNLMLRDFKDVVVDDDDDDGAATAAAAAVKGEERICHEAIQNEDGYAKFVDMCCYASPDMKTPITCEPDLVNIWLRLIQLSLSLIRLGLLFFGPLILTSTVLSLTRKKYPYAVKLKEPLIKTAVFRHRTSGRGDVPVSAKHHVDLRLAEGYPKLKRSLSDVQQLGVPVPIRISQYDVLVAYGRTLTENRVPVGFWRNIFDALFFCKLRNVGPFRDCCAADMFSTVGRCLPRRPTPRRWISVWSRVGLILMVLLIPSPYYLRLFVFYRFEYDEVAARKEAIARSGLRERFAANPLHYFTPTHPVFVFVYVTYFFTVAFIGLTVRRDKEGPILRILAGAFDDLASLPWETVLHVMVSNFVWPFQQFGLVGCAVALVYWPVAIPLTVVTNAIYCLPTVYLTVRMVFYSRNSFLVRTRRRFAVRPYRARRQPDDTIRLFDVGAILRRFHCACDVDQTMPNDEFAAADDLDLDPNDLDLVPSAAARRSSSETMSIASSDTIGLKKNFRRCCTHFLASLLCVACLYSALIVLSECIGCLAEVGFFTLMGVIVNAGALLKYVALFILLFAYSQDCFSNVQKTYLKLNKSLFAEVKGRVKDFEHVTSQPSHLQENQGFKSQEQSEQAFYEDPDDLAAAPPGHWMINDLVLFVDNEDTPRIPKKLFDEVCQIKVAGVPGPVYRGQMIALKRFMKIVVFVAFVFIVVLSFSEAYKISSTNQMLATLAGGFLPLIIRTMMGRDEDELELNTLSFKSKLDEVIKNYHQVWPIYDFPFELAPPSQEPAPAAGDSPDVVDVSAEPVKLAGCEPVGCNSPDVLAASYDRQISYSSQGGVVGRAKSESECTAERQKVTFREEGSTRVVEVDLLIDLPETEEWSDLENYSQMLV